MKKILQGLLATALVATSLSAKTYSSKTFLMPRSDNPNLAMEYTTWHRQIKLHDEDKFGGTIQAVPFYEESDNKKDLGKYFGIYNRIRNNQIDDFIMVDDNDGSHLYTNDIIHFYSVDAYDSTTFANANMSEKIQFRPYRTAYGVRLDYHQKLDMLLDGLFLKVDAPIVHVKHSLGYKAIGRGITQKLALEAEFTLTGQSSLYIPASMTTGADKSLEDYLTGNLVNTSTVAQQVALTHDKIHNGQDETGVADVNVMLGYNLLYEADKQASFNIALLIPTGTTPDGVWKFEPVVGNGGHWALGGGVDVYSKLWEKANKSLEVSFVANYKFLFSGTEKRTLNYKYPDYADFTYPDARVTWGQYVLGGHLGDTFATPMANFTTIDVDVTPGSQINAMIDLTFNWGNWSIDLGYELYGQDQERVAVKSFTDNVYGIADWAWDTSLPFISGTTALYETIFRGAYAASWTTAFDMNRSAIDNSSLLPSDAETPQQITNKVFGGLGYAFNSWNYPIMFGVGGSYEFATGNVALEGWAAWFKAGLTF